MFLAAIKPWEWALLGALIVAVLTGWLVTDKYLSERDKVVGLDQSLAVSNSTVDLQAKIGNITDQAIADAIASTAQKRADLVVSRQGVINEYLAAAVVPDPVEPTQVDAPVPPDAEVDARVQDVPAAAPPAKHPVRASKPAPAVARAAGQRVDHPAARLNQLALRMQQQFCQAVPSDTSCHNPQNTPVAVQG